MIDSYLSSDWKRLLKDEFKLPYMQKLLAFLDDELKDGKTIYPPQQEIFTALNLTPYDKVKVVIIGQDPYHGPNQAHGLCFSVKKGVKTPPSLVNIYKELETDLGLPPPSHGNLTSWAEQGVLMLNNVLTVEDGKAGSHHKKGWEQFTTRIIELLTEKEKLVYILWGSPAQKKALMVDEKKNLVLKSVHPSPLSVYRGFYGSKPFSKTNDYLKKHGIRPIDWQIT